MVFGPKWEFFPTTQLKDFVLCRYLHHYAEKSKKYFHNNFYNCQ